MKMTKIAAGRYSAEFTITFNTQQALAGSTPSTTRQGTAKFKLSKCDESGYWHWELTVVNERGETLYTENDPYPFESKKEASVALDSMVDGVRTFYW